MGKLDGKVAIITGSASGIGKASALLFAKEGAKVVVADIDPKAGEETVKAIKEGGGDAIFVRADVSKSKDVENLVKTTVDTYGRLDVLFNNAGMGAGMGDIVDMTEEQLLTGINVNLIGAWRGMKYAIPEMLKVGGGTIISTSSICGIIHTSNAPADYDVSKAGIIMLTKTAACQFGRQNIRVNCICPGHVSTPLFEKWDIAGEEWRRKKHNDMELIGRVGIPDEIARVALFLACDDSSYITGQALIVDGGHTCLARGYEPGFGPVKP